MQTVAVILHEDGTVAPVDDSGRHFDAIELYQVEDGGTESTPFQFNPKATDFDVHEALKLSHVTDVIAQHFEEGCFERLRTVGINMWLEAPGFNSSESMDAFVHGYLTEAAVGAHAVHGPEGRRVRHAGARERNPAHASPDRGVRSPVRGGKMPF